MKIAVIGTGYVGTVTGVCLAETNNQVICVDKNEQKIATLKQGISDIYEPGLNELLKRNLKNKNIEFTTNTPRAIKESEVIFIAVGTPEKTDGTVDLQHVDKVAEEIRENINGYKVVVNKSTVPIGTGERIKRMLLTTSHSFDIVSNPEFLKEGTSVEDFMKPDRIIIGCDNDQAYKVMKKIYAPFVLNDHPILRMDIVSAELTKYASNAFLATKISFMNEIARFSEKTGADVTQVRKGMTKDKRIGESFLYSGVGYGGSCFPKDVQGLIYQSRALGLSADIITAVHKVNEEQMNFFIDKIFQRFGKVKGLRFAIWGLTFKPETDDIRNAPSLKVIEKLLEKQAEVAVHDPKAIEHVKGIFAQRIQYYHNPYEALEGCVALILCTEWGSYRNPDFIKMNKLMKRRIIFDGRNQLRELANENQFEWHGIGISPDIPPKFDQLT